MMKKKRSILLSVAILVILSVTIATLLQTQQDLARITVYAAGTPDAHNNRIQHCQIYENATWNTTRTTSNYTQGETITVDTGIIVYLIYRVYLNNTFADNSSHAVSLTRIYLNVTGKYTNELLDDEANGTSGNFYYVDYGSNVTSNWTTTADTTYVVSARYDAYY